MLYKVVPIHKFYTPRLKKGYNNTLNHNEFYILL